MIGSALHEPKSAAHGEHHCPLERSWGRCPEQIEVGIQYQPQEAAAPGQAVVCYEGDVVICGGWIDTVERRR